MLKVGMCSLLQSANKTTIGLHTSVQCQYIRQLYLTLLLFVLIFMAYRAIPMIVFHEVYVYNHVCVTYVLYT